MKNYNQLSIYDEQNSFDIKHAMGRQDRMDAHLQNLLLGLIGMNNDSVIIDTPLGHGLSYDFSLATTITNPSGYQTLVFTDTLNLEKPLEIYMKEKNDNTLALVSTLSWSEYTKLISPGYFDGFNVNSMHMSFSQSNKLNQDKSGQILAGVFSCPWDFSTTDCLKDPQVGFNKNSVKENLGAFDDFNVAVPSFSYLNMPIQPDKQSFFNYSEIYYENFKFASATSITLPAATFSKLRAVAGPGSRYCLRVHHGAVSHNIAPSGFAGFTMPAGFSLVPFPTATGLPPSDFFMADYRYDLNNIVISFPTATLATVELSVYSPHNVGSVEPYGFACLDTSLCTINLNVKGHISFVPNSGNLMLLASRACYADPRMRYALENLVYFLREADIPLIYSKELLPVLAGFYTNLDTSVVRASLGGWVLGGLKGVAKWIYDNRKALYNIGADLVSGNYAGLASAIPDLIKNKSQDKVEAGTKDDRFKDHRVYAATGTYTYDEESNVIALSHDNTVRSLSKSIMDDYNSARLQEYLGKVEHSIDKMSSKKYNMNITNNCKATVLEGFVQLVVRGYIVGKGEVIDCLGLTEVSITSCTYAEEETFWDIADNLPSLCTKRGKFMFDPINKKVYSFNGELQRYIDAECIDLKTLKIIRLCDDTYVALKPGYVENRHLYVTPNSTFTYDVHHYTYDNSIINPANEIRGSIFIFKPLAFGGLLGGSSTREQGKTLRPNALSIFGDEIVYKSAYASEGAVKDFWTKCQIQGKVHRFGLSSGTRKDYGPNPADRAFYRVATIRKLDEETVFLRFTFSPTKLTKADTNLEEVTGESIKVGCFEFHCFKSISQEVLDGIRFLDKFGCSNKLKDLFGGKLMHVQAYNSSNDKISEIVDDSWSSVIIAYLLGVPSGTFITGAISANGAFQAMSASILEQKIDAYKKALTGRDSNQALIICVDPSPDLAGALTQIRNMPVKMSGSVFSLGAPYQVVIAYSMGDLNFDTPKILTNSIEMQARVEGTEAKKAPMEVVSTVSLEDKFLMGTQVCWWKGYAEEARNGTKVYDPNNPSVVDTYLSTVTSPHSYVFADANAITSAKALAHHLSKYYGIKNAILGTELIPLTTWQTFSSIFTKVKGNAMISKAYNKMIAIALTASIDAVIILKNVKSPLEGLKLSSEQAEWRIKINDKLYTPLQIIPLEANNCLTAQSIWATDPILHIASGLIKVIIEGLCSYFAVNMKTVLNKLGTAPVTETRVIVVERDIANNMKPMKSDITAMKQEAEKEVFEPDIIDDNQEDEDLIRERPLEKEAKGKGLSLLGEF